jgi:hypothetical protein
LTPLRAKSRVPSLQFLRVQPVECYGVIWRSRAAIFAER